jgi:hypothetical protein
MSATKAGVRKGPRIEALGQELFFNLFGYDSEFFQGLWTEDHRDRDVSGITSASDDIAPMRR